MTTLCVYPFDTTNANILKKFLVATLKCYIVVIHFLTSSICSSLVSALSY